MGKALQQESKENTKGLKANQEVLDSKSEEKREMKRGQGRSRDDLQ
jgi:hypothetical protein